MSRNVPFEDPLLHRPTPPINTETSAEAQKETGQTQQRQSLLFDDGPIPFQTSFSIGSSSVFSPPPLAPTPLKPAVVAPPTNETITPATHSTADAENPAANFLDPLTSAQEQPAVIGDRATLTQASSPNINIPVDYNSIPRDVPTNMASPPIPQHPTGGGTTFSPFQTFSSLLQPPSTSGTPASSIVSGSGTPVTDDISNLSLGSSHGAAAPAAGEGGDPPQPLQESSAVGLHVDNHDGHTTGRDAPVAGQQWTKRHSMGVTTNPSGINLQDQSDMVQQELKSPVQDHAPRYPLTHGAPHESPLADASHQTGDRHNAQLHIKLVDHGREHPVGIRSPGFAVPQSPIRPEGFPTLNSSSMFHEITMSDAMNDMMFKHIPVEQRVLRDWNALTEAEQRQASRTEILHELTINNSWRAMTRYTRSQILATPPDRISELINLWYARLLALVKLGEFEMAQAELDQLGDLRGPQYRYENYPPEMFATNDFQTAKPQHGGAPRKGCIVPFELFVLKARLQGHLGDIYEAIDQLYDLIMRCKKFEAICYASEDSIGVRQWQDLTGQLHLMVLNYLVELKDFPSATRHGRELAKKYPHDISFNSGLGRLYLQLGDLERAEEVFKGVEDMVKGHQTHSEGDQAQAQTHFKLQLTMNRALLAVAQGQWLAAKSAFEEVLAQEPENLAATNNLVVCELYAGQLNEAIPRLERLMFAYPTSAGTSEPLVFNMATLYELRTEGSLRKKQQMMVEVSKWAGDQFNVSMFKM